MIVSHKHRFIFLKTRKTAGTSIEIALSEHCGPKDTISPNDPVDEELRKELGFRGPQNRWVAPWKLGFTGLLGLIQRKEWAFHYNHCIAELVKRRVGTSKFESYTRFCVVRNPWDRAVSMYWWNRNRTDGHAIDESIDFPTYVREAELKLLTDKDIFQIDGEAVVDHFVKFEELQEGLDSVMDDIGLPHLTLPRAKGGTRKTKQHYSLLYDDETMMIIANICAWEIKRFGYEFDDQRSADN